MFIKLTPLYNYVYLSKISLSATSFHNSYLSISEIEIKMIATRYKLDTKVVVKIKKVRLQGLFAAQVYFAIPLDCGVWLTEMR